MTSHVMSWVGTVIGGGRYEIVGKVGEGGMGFVYRARDANLGTDVIIKVPRPAMIEDPAFAERFAREVRSLVRLSHPHIVKVIDVGVNDGIPFAVMQYLSGGSLEDCRPKAADGSPLPVDPSSLGSWLPAVAEALDFIHAQGYVHRDIKPANILFDSHGNAYLSDFGIAKALAAKERTAQAASLTGTGMVLGTPAYMAPELVLGEAFDGRADQYALAVTVYELLSGRQPLEGPTPAAILVQHATQPPRPLTAWLPSILPALSGAVLRGLAKDPQRRFADCRSQAAAILLPAKLSSASSASPPGSTAAGDAGRMPASEEAKNTRPVARAKIDTPSGNKPVAGGPPGSGNRDERPGAGRDAAQAAPQPGRRRISRRMALGVSAIAIFSLAVGLGLLVWPDADAEPGGVVVYEASLARLKPIADQVVDEGQELALAIESLDERVPADSLRFALGKPFPKGAEIDAMTGRFTWTPSEDQGPGEYVFVVEATAPDEPVGVATAQFRVQVNEVNAPPALEPISPQIVTLGHELKLVITAKDDDLPPNKLVFKLDDDAPKGIRLEAVDTRSARLTWVTTTGDKAGTYPFRIIVEDDGSPPMHASETYTVQLLPAAVKMAEDYSVALKRRVSQWIAQLGSEDSQIQKQASEELVAAGRIRLTDVFPGLIEALKGWRGRSTAEVRRDDGTRQLIVHPPAEADRASLNATQILQTLGTVLVQDSSLEVVLASGVKSIRCATAFVLGSFDIDATADELLIALDDTEADVRYEAMVAIIRATDNLKGPQSDEEWAYYEKLTRPRRPKPTPGIPQPAKTTPEAARGDMPKRVPLNVLDALAQDFVFQNRKNRKEHEIDRENELRSPTPVEVYGQIGTASVAMLVKTIIYCNERSRRHSELYLRRGTTSKTLTSLGEEAIPELLAEIEIPQADDYPRYFPNYEVGRALAVLGKDFQKADLVSKQLLEMVQSGRNVNFSAINEVGAAGIPALVESLKSSGDAIRHLQQRIRFGDWDAAVIPPLLKLLDDENLREDLVMRVVRVLEQGKGSIEALPRLRQVAESFKTDSGNLRYIKRVIKGMEERATPKRPAKSPK